MESASSSSVNNVNETAKFKFFKKRRQKPRTPGSFDFNSNNLKNSQGFSQGTNSSPDNSRNSRRKKLDSQPLNSFKGFLKDFEEYDKSQHSANDNIDPTDLIDDPNINSNPEYPNIDLGKCIPVYYISWIRDQLLYGNRSISIQFDNERKMEELLHHQKTKIENLIKHPGINTNHIEILRLLYSRHMSLYKSYLNLIHDGYNYNFNSSDGVYVRILKSESSHNYDTIDLGQFSQFDTGNLTHDSIIFSFIKENNSTSQTIQSDFYIGDHNIQGPTFINTLHLPSDNIPMEYLPIKIGKEYFGDWNENHPRDAITQSLWDRATKELIIVKALVNIPSIPLSKFEGFDIYNISAGERFWAPLYIAERLCYLGLVYIEIPAWLLPAHLKDIHERENKDRESLTKLPCEYFFEISHAFMALSLFKRICFPPFTKLSEYSMFSVISKSSGLIEDIKGCRENKIYTFISNLKTQNFFAMQNLQYSETYIISQFLGVFWPLKSKKMSKNDAKHWKQHIKNLSIELKNLI